MAKNASKTSKTSSIAAPVAVAYATMFPQFDALQVRTTDNKVAGISRSKVIVGAIALLHATSTDYAADTVALLGDGNKGTKKDDEGTKGTLADALTAKHGNLLEVSVRNELSWARIVAANWNIVAVREAAEKSGLRKARDVAKPRAKPETAPETATVAPQYSQSQMVEMVANHFDDAIFAVRAYLLRCADSIGVAKLGEIEVHLANKTRKAS